jgi:ABC-type uncharacterized transport system substrate-binding protein
VHSCSRIAPDHIGGNPNQRTGVYNLSTYTRDGGLLSYGPDFADIFRRSAAYVDRILRGAKPSDLPVQLPIKFELVINLKTAKTFGLTVPQTPVGCTIRPHAFRGPSDMKRRSVRHERG